MGTTEIATALVQPLNKLIDAVTGAIGKAYEPKHIRDMAASKAHEINMISEALRNNADLPFVYDTSGHFSVDNSDKDGILKRTGKRIAYQEVIKQENIEAIIDDTYESLKDIHEIHEGEISREWMHRFIDAAGDISTEELQKIWSKVLAGEVLEPSTFSLRTLECLRNLNVRDAKLFEQLCKLVISKEYVINDDAFLEKHGMTYLDILHLDECGLLNSSGTISQNRNISVKPGIVIDFGEYVLIDNSEEKSKISWPEFPLTEAGRELCSIVDCKIDLALIMEISQVVAEKNNMTKLSLHKVNFRIDSEINYNLEATWNSGMLTTKTTIVNIP